MKVKLFFVFLFSFLLDIAVSPLRGYAGMKYSSLFGFAAFFFLTTLCFNKYKNKIAGWQILLCLLAGLWILQLPMRIVHFRDSLISFPDALVYTLGVFCGFLYWQLKSPLNILTSFLGFSIAVFMFFQGYDLWLHKLNYGTFTGKVEAHNLPAKFEAFDEQKKLKTDEDFDNKIVLLDFWTTTCGVCFKKFPQVQAVYEKYKNDSSVIVLAVNMPIEEDKLNQAFNSIREEGHTFPVVIAKDEDLAEKFGVKGYPTTFVINRNRQIVFKGDIEGAVKVVENILHPR